MPSTITEVQARLRAPISYRRDIFILHDGASLPLWKEDSRFAAAGLDFILGRGSRWYAQHNEGSAIKQGDRVAVIGWGTALVEEIDSTYIRAQLGDKSGARIARKSVCWNQQNVRWETDKPSVL